MVVRETLHQMAGSLVRSSAELRVPAAAPVEPLTVDVLGDATAGPGDAPPQYEVKQGDTRLSSQNLAALTTGLKIVTSLRSGGGGSLPHALAGAAGKAKGAAAGGGVEASTLRRSEDDDGYCSRSSLDSPVQITRPDAADISPTAEDSVDPPADPAAAAAGGSQQGGSRSLCASPQRVDSVHAEDELRADCTSETVSLDHCYLTASKPPSPLPQTAEDSSEAAGAGRSAAGARPRNISIFVVPQPMPSTGLRWRARIIRADEGSDVAAGGDQQSSDASTSWVPLTAVAGGSAGRVKSPAHVRRGGYRGHHQQQQQRVGSRLAALTATADSLSRQIARVAAARRPAAATTERGRRSTAAATAADLSVRLHPLVDHDYGAFATFNAEVALRYNYYSLQQFVEFSFNDTEYLTTVPSVL